MKNLWNEPEIISLSLEATAFNREEDIRTDGGVWDDQEWYDCCS